MDVLGNIKQVEDTIKKLNQNDLVIVYWMDASSFPFDKIKDGWYRTDAETVGYFVCYKDGYLIIVGEKGITQRMATSIPVGCIKKIEVLKKKKSKKTVKIPTTFHIKNGDVKIVYRIVKVCS